MNALPVDEDGAREKPKRMPAKPLVLYRLFDAEDNLLYIGITNSPLTRFSSHQADKAWFRRVVRSTMVQFATRQELEAAEIVAIRAEKPKYNVAYSVTSPTDRIGVTPKARYANSADANRFPKPDAIACDEPTEAEREATLVDLERRARQYLQSKRCPSCELLTLFREYDGLIRCDHCLNMWTAEELPSDLEVLKRLVEESK